MARTFSGARALFVICTIAIGAIALGMKKLGYRTRPKEMAKLQAAAAAGQSLLMRVYEEAFETRGISVAQVLLTHADLADRVRSNNARAALGALLDARVVPILNENDSVAVDEIKFGDNDQLAAMVAPEAFSRRQAEAGEPATFSEKVTSKTLAPEMPAAPSAGWEERISGATVSR